MNKLTARHRVLAYLRKERAASPIQIGRALKMSAATVRHHLYILREDGRIVVKGEEGTKKRGRPSILFGLSEKSLGDNLPLLSNTLLENVLKNLPSSRRQALLHRLAASLADQIGRTNPSEIIIKRINDLLEKLNEMHYESRWEAGAEGPRILFAHCPYATIIDRHPELCQLDGYLLEEEIGTKTLQAAKIDLKPGGVTHCIFVVKS